MSGWRAGDGVAHARRDRGASSATALKPVWETDRPPRRRKLSTSAAVAEEARHQARQRVYDGRQSRAKHGRAGRLPG